LPSIRQHLRNDLFVLRDELRQYRLENPDVNIKAFNFLSEGINSHLTRLSFFSIGLLARVSKKLREDPKLLATLKEKDQFFIDHSDDALKNLKSRTNKVLDKAVFANMGGWFVYAVPVILLMFFLGLVHSLSKKILMMPPNKVAEFLPYYRSAVN
jgi:hypothetical protein